MDKTIDMSTVAVPASTPEMGELSDGDLEMVVGGLTRAWVNEPEVGLGPSPIGVGAPGAPLLKPSAA
jgi:hypothetical protein